MHCESLPQYPAMIRKLWYRAPRKCSKVCSVSMEDPFTWRYDWPFLTIIFWLFLGLFRPKNRKISREAVCTVRACRNIPLWYESCDIVFRANARKYVRFPWKTPLYGDMIGCFWAFLGLKTERKKNRGRPYALWELAAISRYDTKAVISCSAQMLESVFCFHGRPLYMTIWLAIFDHYFLVVFGPF